MFCLEFIFRLSFAFLIYSINNLIRTESPGVNSFINQQRLSILYQLTTMTTKKSGNNNKTNSPGAPGAHARPVLLPALCCCLLVRPLSEWRDHFPCGLGEVGWGVSHVTYYALITY